MMRSGGFYQKMVIPYLAAKMSFKQAAAGAKTSSCRRVDDVTEMMSNKKEKKRGRFQRVVKAENGIWGGRVRAIKWLFKADDERADAVGTVEKRSASQSSGVFWKVAAARKSRLVQRMSVMKRDRERFELCKRRILMGVRWKPVNASGKLHYGRDGVILAEDQAF